MDDNSVERMLPGEDVEAEVAPAELEIMRQVWLDNLENERDALIMRLRRLDKVLIRYGRLSSETIPRRSR